MFEKEAEEYADECFKGDDKNSKYYRLLLITGYLDGLAEGKPKWHRVADGDYPPYDRYDCSINVLTDSGDIAYYNYVEECWVAEPSSSEIDPPVAWCKIPKYTK